mgnify:CR=1 FL=1
MTNTKGEKISISHGEQTELLEILKARFEKNMNRHKDIEWVDIDAKLKANTEKLWTLNEMERTGGDPDVVDYDQKKDEYIFVENLKVRNIRICQYNDTRWHNKYEPYEDIQYYFENHPK